MGIMPDVSPCGSQTVTGPGWPNVDEDALASAAASYEALATKLSGTVVPQQQGQLMKLSANTTELANTLGVPPNIPQTGAPPTPPGAQQAAGQDPQQAIQMLSQMGSLAGQLPQQISPRRM